MHINKDDDKIVITQSTHNTYTSLMTRSKTKSTTAPTTKLASEHTCLLKMVGTCDNYSPFITLAFFRVKVQSLHGREKCSPTLKDSRDESFFSIVDVNSNTNSLIRMSKVDNSSKHFDSFTSSFLMIMLVMTMNTTSVKEQLIKMTHVIAKLTKTIEKKDLQIASLMNKVEA